MKMRLQLPKNNYEPGEEIKAKVNIDNSLCTMGMSGMKIRLRMLACIKNHDNLKRVFLVEENL